MSRRWKIAGIRFDHGHMEGLLRLVREHPGAELVGICDDQPERMKGAIESLSIPREAVFVDYRACLESTRPDVVILCPATARHGEWTENVAAFGPHVLMEKPFSATLAEADRMIAAVEGAGRRLAINWPLAWYPVHVTTRRLIQEGAIGEPLEVHYYDGNAASAFREGGLLGISGTDVPSRESTWFLRGADGGGSLLDYLGYGTTLGTWFLNGKAPIEVSCTIDQVEGLEVDTHSITVARYDTGLSKFETRWGTFTDPWTLQPQPKCGFVVVGRAGTISSYDYERTVRLQTREHPEGQEVPVDTPVAPRRNPIEYFLHCLETGEEIEGPLSPRIARIGQRIVEAAVRSTRLRRPVELPA